MLRVFMYDVPNISLVILCLESFIDKHKYNKHQILPNENYTYIFT